MVSDNTGDNLFNNQTIFPKGLRQLLTAAKPISAIRRIIDARREMTGMMLNAMRCCVIGGKLVEVQSEDVGGNREAI